MPMTLMGLQVTPIIAVTSLTLMFKRPRSLEIEGSLAVPVLLQHWTGPVLHWLAGMGVVVATPVAAARVVVAAATAKKARVANCMFESLV